MKRSYSVFAIAFTVSILIGVQAVEGVNASPPSLNVTICPDGRIEPSIAPIKIQGSTYTLTGDLLNSSLHIQRSNVTFNGANYTVYGRIWIENDYITVDNTVINSGSLGILVNGSHTVISNNIFFRNLADISLPGGPSTGYAKVIGNNVTSGAYSTFYVDSDYNNLTKNNLVEILVGGNHNVIANNTVDRLYMECGDGNIYLDNIVKGQLQTSTPEPLSPILRWMSIDVTVIIIVILAIAIVSFVYFKRRKGKP